MNASTVISYVMNRRNRKNGLARGMRWDRGRERGDDVEELHLRHQLPRMACRPELQPPEQLLAQTFADVRLHEHAGHRPAAVSERSPDLAGVLWVVDHQRAASLDDLKLVDGERALGLHHLLELPEAGGVHGDVEAVTLLALQ